MGKDSSSNPVQTNGKQSPTSYTNTFGNHNFNRLGGSPTPGQMSTDSHSTRHPPLDSLEEIENLVTDNTAEKVPKNYGTNRTTTSETSSSTKRSRKRLPTQEHKPVSPTPNLEFYGHVKTMIDALEGSKTLGVLLKNPNFKAALTEVKQELNQYNLATPNALEKKYDAKFWESFDRKIEILNKKMARFNNDEDLNNPEAALALQVLLSGTPSCRTDRKATISAHRDGLSVLKYKFMKGEITSIEFKEGCKNAIDSARPILEKHRGMKNILANFAFAILGFVPWLVVSGIHKIVTGRFSIFSTDTEAQLDRTQKLIIDGMRFNPPTR